MSSLFNPRIGFVLILTALSGCTPNTKITGSWKNPSLNRNYHTVFVSALTSNAVVRATIEDEMAKALSAKGMAPIKSIDVFPPGFLKDSVERGYVMNVIRKKKADAIMTIALQKKETESRYVSGTYAPMSYGYYGSFGGYYGYNYSTMYSPGYYTQDQVYYLETNLYDVGTEQLVWSAQSRTYIYDNVKDLSTEFSTLVVQRMRKDTILK